MPADLDALVRALRARNFEVLYSVGIAPPTSIRESYSASDEVGALTGLDALEAHEAIEQGNIILDSLTLEQAEQACERLAAADGQASRSFARAHLYAYLPEHQERAGQTCERLTVDGETLELARNQVGLWERRNLGAVQALAIDEGDLLGAIDRQRASWAASGWREASSELEILHRLNARDEHLEARIRVAEADLLAHEAAVYGDWLLAQGDARGLVASAALSLDAARDDVERAERLDSLKRISAQHLTHMFGPVSSWGAMLWALSVHELRWMGPMVGSATFQCGQELENLLQLERMLAVPVCAGLRTLAIRSRFTGRHDLAAMVARSSCASSLRSLSLEVQKVSFMDVRFERLERLELRVDRLTIAGLSVPKLRWLGIEQDGPTIVHFDAPALEHFEWKLQHGLQHHHIATLLGLPAFARLRSLTLCSLRYSTPYSAGLAQMLARLPARHTLESIDLSGANLSTEARDELEVVRGGPRIILP